MGCWNCHWMRSTNNMPTLSDTAKSARRIRQRIIAEWDGLGWLVMLEDGTVKYRKTPETVMSLVKSLAHAAEGDIIITVLEWRNTPDGFVPPKGY